jgi:hypothetical protein
MHRRPDKTTRPIPRTQPYDPFVRVCGGSAHRIAAGAKARRGCVDGSDAAVGPRPSPHGGPGPTTRESAAADDFHVHQRSIRQIALQPSDVAERPELSVQRPLQIADSSAPESAPNQGDTDHRIVERGHVGSCVHGQTSATVLVPRHRAELSWPPRGAGRRDEWHSIPVLGRGSQIAVYSGFGRHARPERVGRAAASPSGAKPRCNVAYGARAQLWRASKDGCSTVRGSRD